MSLESGISKLVRGKEKPPSGERADLKRDLRKLWSENMSPEELQEFRSGKIPKGDMHDPAYWATKPEAAREQANQILARLAALEEPERETMN